MKGQIILHNSGTAANPITIKAQNKWGAVLSSISGDNPAISIDGSYITIEDMRISVSPNNGNIGVVQFRERNQSGPGIRQILLLQIRHRAPKDSRRMAC